MSTYQIWSLALNALMFISAAVAAIFYYRQLKIMQAQFQGSVETAARLAHMELLKLVIGDKDILPVWKSDIVGNIQGADSNEASKRHMFINLHLSHIETLYELGRLTTPQIEAEIKHHAKNEHYIKFWKTAAPHRGELISQAHPKAQEFHKICQAAFTKA